MYSGNDQFVNATSNALNDLMNGGNVGETLVQDLAGRSDRILLGESKRGNFEIDDPGNTNYSSIVGFDLNSKSPFGGKQFVALGHELTHSKDRLDGNLDMNIWQEIKNGQSGSSETIPKCEISAIHTENQIRAENNLPLRTHYGDLNGNGTGTSVLFGKTRQSRYYNSAGIANPKFKTIKRKTQLPFIY